MSSAFSLSPSSVTCADCGTEQEKSCLVLHAHVSFALRDLYLEKSESISSFDNLEINPFLCIRSSFSFVSI